MDGVNKDIDTMEMLFRLAFYQLPYPVVLVVM